MVNKMSIVIHKYFAHKEKKYIYIKLGAGSRILTLYYFYLLMKTIFVCLY